MYKTHLQTVQRLIQRKRYSEPDRKEREKSLEVDGKGKGILNRKQLAQALK